MRSKPRIQAEGNKAFQTLSEIIETNNESARKDNPIPLLVSLVADAADSEYPDSMKHLTYILDWLVPQVFHPATHDWINIIGKGGLSQFFNSLTYSQPGLQAIAGRFAELQPGQRKKPLIVHVDDDAGILGLIKLIIEHKGGGEVMVESVSDGAGGLILASALQPDLILTDVMEPGMDGYTFAGYLKDNPLTCDIPFVFVTAVQRIEFGLNLGAKDYITKPFSPKDLVASIQKVLELEPEL